MLAGAVGLVAITACDTDDLRPPKDDAQSSAATSPTPSTSAATDPDTLLVDRVNTAIIGASLTVAAARRLPRLRRPLASLQSTHLAHLAALDGELEGPQPPRPTSAAAALRNVRAGEQRLQRTLVDAALEARSGALARLLASMSASVSQHLAAL